MSEMDIKAQVSLYTQGYESGLAKIRSENQSFVSSLSGISPMIAGAFSFGSIVGGAEALLEMGHSLEITSKNMHINVESLQALRAAAKQAGVDVESFDAVLGRILKAQSAALDGDKKMIEAFKGIGVSVAELADMGTDEIYARMGKAIVETHRSAEAMHGMFQIAGRTSAQFLGALEDLGARGLDPTIAKFKQLGMVITESQVKALGDAKESWDMFGAQVKTTSASIYSDVITKVSAAMVLLGGVSQDDSYWKPDKGSPSAKPKTGMTPGGETEADRTKRENEEKRESVNIAKLRETAEEKIWEAGVKKLSTDKQILEYQEKIRRIGAQSQEQGYAGLVKYLKGVGDIASANEKITELQDKQKHKQDEADKKMDERVEKIFKLQDEEAKIKADEKKQQAALGKMHVAPLMTDSLAKTGGYVGGQVNPQMRVAEKALQVAEKAVELHKEANVKLQKLSDEVRELQE